MHQAPREIRILKHLYTFQGIFSVLILVYFVGLSVRAYYSPTNTYVTGAGAIGAILFPFLLLGILLASLLFLLIARGIVRGKYRDLGLVVSGLGLLTLPQGLLQAVSFMLSLQYPADHVFSGADWIHLFSVICPLIFGVASSACVYYLTRPTAKTFLLSRTNRQERTIG